MMRRLFLSLLRTDRGSASVEFALASLFFFGVIVVALDFAVYAQQRLKLANAVEEGAVLAFNTRDSVNTSTIASFIKAESGSSNTPTINCNEGVTCAAAASRTSTDYRCINSVTGAIDPSAQAAGASCGSGGNAGYYLKIVATRTFNSVIVPDRWLGGSTITQTAVVRLQ